MRATVALACVLALGCGKKKGTASGPAADAAVAGPSAGAGERALPRSRVIEVSAEDVTPEELGVFTLDVAAAKQAAEKALAASGAFEPAGAKTGVPHRLRIEVGSQVGAEKGKQPSAKPTGPAVVHVLIEATLTATDDPEIPARTARSVIEREFNLRDRDAVQKKLAADLDRAITDTVGDLVAEERMRSGELAEVEAGLGAPDAEQRKLAIHYAGERHARALVPRLVKLLADGDPEVRDSAIGALVTIGDRSAVKPITDLVQFKDVDGMRRIIDAVATLGGDDARSYLELVASAHEDPRIKALAESALKRMPPAPASSP